MTVVAQFARILDHSRERLLCDTGEGSSHVSNSEQTSEVDMVGVCLPDRRGIREFFFGRNEKKSTARPRLSPRLQTHYQCKKSGKAVWKQEKIQEFLLPGFVAFSIFLCRMNQLD